MLFFLQKNVYFYRLILFAFFSSFIFSASVINVYSGIQKNSEDEIRAEFILNLAKFIKWPKDVFDTENNTLTLCIIGKEPLLEAFNYIGGRLIFGKILVVNQITEIGDLTFSHILYISKSEKSNLHEILDKVKNKSILTICELDGFINIGGMINLYIQKNEANFAININSIRQANLKVSSKILKLARSIINAVAAEEDQRW